MERMSRVEQSVTSEKSRDELCFDTLKTKRDVLSSHYTLNQLRKGRKVEEMSEAEIEDYKSVKKEYDKRKELFLASFNNLSEDDGQNISELTSLTKVEIVLSSLEKPAEVEIEATQTPESNGQPAVEAPVRQTPEEIAGETRIHQEESQEEPVDKTKELEHILAEKYRILYQEVSVIDRRPLEEEIRALEAELEAEKQRPEAELLARQEAETNPDRPAPKGFMQRVRDSYEKAKDAILGSNRISGGSETVESRMSPLGLRHQPLTQEAPRESVQPIRPETSQPGPTQPETASQQAEKEPKKPSTWGWIKERGKGLLTFGLWEFHQAERFRSKTKETANDTEALASLIQQERNLSLEEAEKEAWETVEELKKSNLDISAPEFYQANKDITERKSKVNSEEIEYIIKNAGNELAEKLAKYRGFSGEDVLTRENQLAFEADLRGELNKMRDGAARKDFINFAKIMRRNLDENWHWRYVWGTAEAVLGFAGVKYLVMKIEQAALAKLLAAEKGGVGAVKDVWTGMHKNIWDTLKNLARQGPKHLNLDDQTLTDLSQKVLDNNGMYEPEWTQGVIDGLKSSRSLPEGLTLKIPLDVMRALGFGY